MRTFQVAAEEFNGILVEGTGELNAAEGSSNGFAAKLVVLKRVANRLDEPTQRILKAGDEYMRTLLALDPSFRALAEIGHAQTAVTPSDREALVGAQDSVRGMVQAGAEATAQVRSAIQSGRSLARTSRDLRPALKRYETGSQNIIDGQAIMEEWSALLDAVEFPESEASALRHNEALETGE